MSMTSIIEDGRLFALILRAAYTPSKTEFLTPPDLGLQLGLIVYGKDGQVAPHRHMAVARNLSTTLEVLTVRKGCCICSIYRDDNSLLESHQLNEGDVIILVCGGHGFRMLEDTVLLEVKQGPYIANADKERINPLAEA